MPLRLLAPQSPISQSQGVARANSLTRNLTLDYSVDGGPLIWSVGHIDALGKPEVLQQPTIVAFMAIALSWVAADACARSRERISGAYSVDGLGLGEPVVPNSGAYKRYKCAMSEQYKDAKVCRFKQVKDGAVQNTTILHQLDNTAIYINRGISPAFFDKGLFRSVRFDQHLVCDGLSGEGDG